MSACFKLMTDVALSLGRVRFYMGFPGGTLIYENIISKHIDKPF